MTWLPGPTREEYFAQEFARRKREWDESKSTHWPALYEAVGLAGANSIALPEWVVHELLKLIIARHYASGRKRSRSKYALDYTHRRRWDALTCEFKIRGIEYSKKSGRPNGTHGIQEARQAAVDSLKKTVARGTPRQVQDSFDIVEKARAIGADARFFFER
jgi:hypothetical protein